MKGYKKTYQNKMTTPNGMEISVESWTKEQSDIDIEKILENNIASVEWETGLTAHRFDLDKLEQELKTYISNLLDSTKLENERVLDGFADWLKDKNSEDIQYWVCPECNSKRQYFSKHDSMYCEYDGRKKQLKVEREVKDDYVSVYDLKGLAEEYKAEQHKRIELVKDKLQ